MDISSLPYEIVGHILDNKNLGINDVKNVALTCKKFYAYVTENNTLWSKKCFQRWPSLGEISKNHGVVGEINWYEETKEKVSRCRKLQEYLLKMSSKHYVDRDIADSDMRYYDDLFVSELGVSATNYYVLMDELLAVIEEPDPNLTNQHYARKIFAHMKRVYLTEEWQKFVALPIERQTLERGAIFLAHWIHPSTQLSATRLHFRLDGIARQTRALLSTRHPELAINRTPIDEVSQWWNLTLDDNKWSNDESRIIITTLSEMLFTTMKFGEDCERHLIDATLLFRKGARIILMIIYESVARRLGLRFEIVRNILYGDFDYSDGRYRLRWKERYIDTKGEKVVSHYLDVLNFGRFLHSNDDTATYDALEAETAVVIVPHIAEDIKIDYDSFGYQKIKFHSVKELRHMIVPRDAGILVDLIEWYILQRINPAEPMEKVRDIVAAGEWQVPDNQVAEMKRRYMSRDVILEIHEQRRTEALKIRPKLRTPRVNFAVGMIVAYGGAKCVVASWREAQVVCRTNEHANDVRENQSDVQVVCDLISDWDDRLYPVRQEYLEFVESPESIYCPPIGKYFYKFTGTHYAPNEETAKMFPEDEEFILRLYNANRDIP